jgi:uncharacterized protein
MRRRFYSFLVGTLWLVTAAVAAEVIPAAPPDHFNDYASLVNRQVAARLENTLTEFERTTSNQILVVIYPHMESDSSIEDYTVRVAQSWRVGQKGKKNGAVLFIFSQDRKLYIQVGYGLEGALPDARCKQIIENEITPHFRAGDFSGGVAAGVDAMIAAARGEYTGSGRLVADQNGSSSRGPGAGMIFAAILVIIVISSLRRRRTYGYSRGGRFFPPVYVGNSSWGSGGRSSGGGGSFSGGGGSFGGGGAGGSW